MADDLALDRYSIRVTKDYLVFCCGHFITYDGDTCERLHGHNYRAAVTVEAPLDENYYVFDFIALKRRTQAIVNELDHHMLLATKNRLITVHDAGENHLVKFGAKHWSFPKEDCVLLPIQNTTAEQIASWIGLRLRKELLAEHQFTPRRMIVEVEETTGQVAYYEWTPPPENRHNP
ncbi:MAG: 6-pyruvoyl trahydropterin synthase family protein [Gemmataceae bacterium]